MGVVVQIPFINQAMYVGPLAKAMNGADISWIVSLIVTSLVYYPLARRSMNVPGQMIYPSPAPAATTGADRNFAGATYAVQAG